MNNFCPGCGSSLIERRVVGRGFNAETGRRVSYTYRSCPNYIGKFLFFRWTRWSHTDEYVRRADIIEDKV